jgi:hypothetical protein
MAHSSDDEERGGRFMTMLKHPRTLRAYERRMEAVLLKRRPLTPEQTAVYRKPCIGDFDRLSVPQLRRKFRRNVVESHVSASAAGGGRRDVLVPPRPTSASCIARGSSSPSREVAGLPPSFSPVGRPSSAAGLTTSFDGSVVFATKYVEMESEPLITNKDRQKMLEEERLAKMVAHVGPSKHAQEVAKTKEQRLDQSRLSKRLFHAIHGQALEKVIATSVKKADAANFSKMFGSSANAATNSIFITESISSDDVTGGRDGSPGGTGAVPLSKYADASFRSTVTTISSREYIVLRQLFVEIDEDRSGFLELHELMSYQKQFPKRLSTEVLEHLPLEIDGKIYLDDFIMAHFPSVDKSAVEQLMVLHEPKVQASMTSLAPESLRAIVRSHQTIVEEFGHLTLQAWISAMQEQEEASGGVGSSCGLAPVLAGAGRKRRTSLGLTLQSFHNPAPGTPRGSEQAGAGGAGSAAPLLSTINAYQFFCHMNRATDVSIVEFVNICKLRQLNLKPNKAEILASGIFIPPGLFDSPFATGPEAGGPALGGWSASSRKEPNVPFLLACPITQKDFLVLVADYYAMCQSKESVNAFNPRFRDQLESWRWERLFPHTGAIRNYFKTPAH